MIKDEYIPRTIFTSPTYYAKWAAARPRITQYVVDGNGLLTYTFLKSSDEHLLIRKNATCEAYGYVMKTAESLRMAHPAVSNLIAMPQEANVLPHLCIYYPVMRQQVVDYLEQKKISDISLNQYLSDILKFNVIAECHDNRLADLNLSDGDFSGVYFSRADLTRCDLSHTRWKDARLDLALFEDNELEGADFQAAYAEKSTWENIVFKGNFSDVKLNGAKIKNSKINSRWLQIGIETERITKKITAVKDANERLKQEMDTVEAEIIDVKERVSVLEGMDERRVKTYMQERWQDHFDTPEFKQTKARYIEPDVISASGLNNTREALWDILDAFYSNQEKVLLIHSGTGIGKSLLATLWEDEVLQRYKEKTDWLPIHINLKQVDGRENFLLEALKSVYANEQTRSTLYSQFRCFFIFDGLEECGVLERRHILEECISYAVKHWPIDRQPKFLILSQTRYLCEKFEDYHQALRLDRNTLFPTQSEYILQPFSTEQIIAYRKMYEVEDADFISRFIDYQHKENAIDLVAQSPLMLHMICELLKQVRIGEPLPSCHVEFYNAIMRNYFHHAQVRIMRDDFSVESLHFYIQAFAMSMLKSGRFWVDKLPVEKKQDALSFAFHEASHAAQTDPISFLFHNALSEVISYFVPVIASKQNKNGIVYFRYTFTHLSFAYDASAKFLLSQLLTEPTERAINDWNCCYLTDFPETLDFLEELILLLSKPFEREALFMDGLKVPYGFTPETIKTSLLEMVFASQGETGLKYQAAASNAISLLNRLGFNFSHELKRGALRHIHIAKADLSRAPLAFMDLSYSDLSGVNFREAVLIGANLRNTHLERARFLDSLLFLYRDMNVETFASHPFSDNVIAHDRKKDDRFLIDIVSVLDETIYATVPGHGKKVLSMSWGPEGYLATAGEGAKIRIWEMPKNGKLAKEIKAFKNYDRAIVGIAWSGDGKFIASISEDNTLQIWDMEQEKRVYLDKAPSVIGSVGVVWGVKTNRVFLACLDGTLYSWCFKVAVTKTLEVAMGRQSQVTGYAIASIAVSSDEKRLAFGCNNGFIYIHEILSNGQLKSEPFAIKSKSFGAVTSLYWHEDALIFATADQLIRVWNVVAGRCVGIYQSHGTTVRKLEVLANRRHLIVGGNQSALFSVFDTAQNNKVDATLEQDVRITSLAAFGHRLAYGGITGVVLLRELQSSPYLVRKISTDDLGAKIRKLAWSEDGKYLASMGDNHLIKLTKMNDAFEERLIKLDLRTSFNDLCFLSHVVEDAYFFAIGASNGGVDIWRVGSRGKIAIVERLHLTQGSVQSISSSPAFLEKQYLAVANGPFISIMLFNNGKHQSVLREFVAENEAVPVMQLTWSKDGRWLASLHVNQTIKIWDTITWACEQRFEVGIDEVKILWVAMLDGQQLFIVGSPKQTLIFNAEVWGLSPIQIAVGGECYAQVGDSLVIAHKKGSLSLGLCELLAEDTKKSAYQQSYTYDFSVVGADFTDAQGLSSSLSRLLREAYAVVPAQPMRSVGLLSWLTGGDEAAQQSHRDLPAFF